MDLSLSTEQEQLQETVRRFLREEKTNEKMVSGIRSGLGLDRETLKKMGDIGWLAMAVPAALDGVGASPTDVAVLHEELGTSAIPGPLFETAVLAPMILSALGANPVTQAALGALMTGESVATVVMASNSGLPVSPGLVDATLSATSLSGTARAVRGVRGATHALVIAPVSGSSGDVACAYVDLSAAGTNLVAVDGFLHGQAVIEWRDVSPVAVHMLSNAEHAAVVDAVLASIPALCATQLGSCRTTYELCVAYSRERVQFGRPIGAFQRVQDHIIEIASAMESARLTTYFALSKLDAGHAVHRESIHVAKSCTSEGHYEACTHAAEVHGGIGSSLEYPLAVHIYQSRELFGYLGDPGWHRARLADTFLPADAGHSA